MNSFFIGLMDQSMNWLINLLIALFFTVLAFVCFYAVPHAIVTWKERPELSSHSGTGMRVSSTSSEELGTLMKYLLTILLSIATWLQS